MKHWYFLALIALIGFAFCSCENMGKKQKEYYVEDLQGKWCKEGTQDYRRFSTEQASQEGYFWGWEWDEGEDVQESDRTSRPQGNGWFMYTIVGDQLREIEKTEYGWTDIPKVYVISELTSTKLVYYPKDYPKEKRYYNKVNE